MTGLTTWSTTTILMTKIWLTTTRLMTRMVNDNNRVKNLVNNNGVNNKNDSHIDDNQVNHDQANKDQVNDNGHQVGVDDLMTITWSTMTR